MSDAPHVLRITLHGALKKSSYEVLSLRGRDKAIFIAALAFARDGLPHQVDDVTVEDLGEAPEDDSFLGMLIDRYEY